MLKIKRLPKLVNINKTIHTMADMVKTTDPIKIILHRMATNRGKPIVSIEIITLVRLFSMASLLRTSVVAIVKDKTANMQLEMGLLSLKRTRKTEISRVGGPSPTLENRPTDKSIKCLEDGYFVTGHVHNNLLFSLLILAHAVLYLVEHCWKQDFVNYITRL